MDNRENFEKTKERIRQFLVETKKNNLYYRKMMEDYSIDLRADYFDYSEFTRIPIMSKKEYRINQTKIDAAIEGMQKMFFPTSGSTGNPLMVWRAESDDIRMNFVLNKYRNNYLNGIVGKKGIFFHLTYHREEIDDWKSGDLSINYDRPNFFRARYYFLGEVVYKKSVEMINKEKPMWIVGSVSFLYNLALYIVSNGGLKHQVQYIECNSEYMGEERYTIEKAFGVKPVSLYGANEFNGIAYECKCGKMHVLQENVFLEIEEKTKNVIATSISNIHNPFIRYRLGDVAEWGEECDCSIGKYGTTTISLSGFRAGDVISLKDGKVLDFWFFAGLFICLKNNWGISVRQYKIIKYIDGIKFLLSIDEVDDVKKEIVENYLKDEVVREMNFSDKIAFEFVNRIEPDIISGKVKYLVQKQEIMK